MSFFKEMNRRQGLMALFGGATVALSANPADAQTCTESVCMYEMYPNDIKRPRPDEIAPQPQHTVIIDGKETHNPHYTEMTKLRANGVIDLEDFRVYPSGATITYEKTIFNDESRILPSPNSGPLPLNRIGGGTFSIGGHQDTMRLDAPEGSWVVYVEVLDKPDFMRGPEGSSAWVWMPEGGTITNTNTGQKVTYIGSFALPVFRKRQDQLGNITSHTQLAHVNYSSQSA